jgi:hypothetical protein
MASWSKFESVNTSVAGVMSGPEVATRQLALSMIKENIEQRIAADPKDKRFFFDLVPEPENPYDADAIQVMADVPGLGRVQLGYIRNSDTICDFCEHMMERYPTSKKCPKCQRTDHLRREGLATRVAAVMRENPSCRFYGEVLQVTGGVDGKCFGCNFVVRQVIQQPNKKKETAGAR